MSEYKIHINDTKEKEDYLVVIIIDDKHKTEASFALSKTESIATKSKLIRSAIAKVTFLNATQPPKVAVKKAIKKVAKKAVKKTVKKSK